MQNLLFLLIIGLPLGEARVSGLAGTSVTIADQPLALYVNPALLSTTLDRKLLYNPLGFQFNNQGNNIVSRIMNSFTQIGFIGYTQPLNGFGAGLAGYQDEDGGRGILLGAAYPLSFLHTGLSLGIRYREYGQSRFQPAFALGLAIPGIKFADVPGEISVALAARQVEWFAIQAGMDYQIHFLRFLVNFNIRDPFAEGINRSAVHLATLVTLEDLLGFDAEFGGGWASDDRWGLLAAADLNLCHINLSYSNGPNTNGQIGFSFLFNIASTKEVEERLVFIENERKNKSRITSNTYFTQGVDAYNESDYDGAIQAFDLALIWDPTNKDALDWIERVQTEKITAETDALLAAANAAMRTKNYLEALNQAKAALEIDSANSEAKSIAKEAERKYSSVIFSQTASSRNSGQINALYQQGMEYYAAGNYKAAEEAWEKIEKLQPRSKTVKTYKAQTSKKIAEQIADGMAQLKIYERKGQWKEALQLATYLKKLAPRNREIKSKLNNYNSKIKTLTAQYESEGIDYFNRGYYVKAQKSFYSVLTLSPTNATAKNYLERIKTKLKAKDADALYLQGVQAYSGNHYQQAINYWEQVLAIDPSYENAARNIQRAKEKLAQLK